MLTSICIVYSICHQALTIAGLIQDANYQFHVKVSKTWAKGFLPQHKEAIKAKNSKLLANERLDPDMVESAVNFCTHVETVAEFYPMKEYNVVNYDKI